MPTDAPPLPSDLQDRPTTTAVDPGDLHRRAAASATLSESRLKVLLQSAPVGIFMLVNRVFVEVNDRLCELLGYPREALLGQTTRLCYVTEEDYLRLGEDIYPRLARDGSAEIEFRARRGDGRIIDVLVTCAAVDRTDLAQGVVSTLRDVTALRRDQALVEARLALTTGPATADLDTLLRTALATAERMTGSRIAFFHFIHPDQENLSLQAWSTRTTDQGCQVSDLCRHYPLSQAGVWADCARQGVPVIHNAYQALPHRQGLPQGHVALTRELTVPVKRGDLLAAVMGVGNKPEDYTEADQSVVAAIAAMILDPVEALRADEALRRANARLLEAQRLARLGDWHYDVASRKLQWSPQVYAILGLDPARDPPAVATAARLIHPDHQPLFQADLARALDAGTAYEHELKIIRPDGTRCHIHHRGHVECDPEGRPSVLFGTIQDVTERTQTEERLRQAARVFESTSEGVIITDAQARILAVNQAFTRITGYAEPEVLGKTPQILRSGRHDQGFYAQLWGSLSATGQWHGEIWNRRRNGDVFPEWLTISAVPDQTGQTTHYVAVFSDISQLKRSQERLDFLAHHDALTRLPNRVLLQDRLAHAIRRAQREAGRLVLLFVDLDGFKEVNDTLGHAVGDRVLMVVAERLGERLRAADTLARHGGDEFLILLDGDTDATGAATAADACLSVLSEPIAIDANAIHISASIGIALHPTDGADAETLLQSADLAMYRAKERGRGQYQFHAPEMTAAIQEQHALETALRGALARGELAVHYQPQVELADGRLFGIEALARWTHPELGPIPPARFIPIAERIGLISEIGDWVLTQACSQLAAWRAAGLPVPAMAVNVSIQQLERATLLPAVRRVLEETGVAAGDLELEVTESVIMGDNPRVITALSDLRALGVRLVVDDFGTGSSALGRLNRVPIDRLKVHGSFVREIGRGPREKAIIRAIIGLGRDLGLEVLALGVEREVQRNVLRAVECRYAQGYLFGPPMDAASLSAHLVGWPMATR